MKETISLVIQLVSVDYNPNTEKVTTRVVDSLRVDPERAVFALMLLAMNDKNSHPLQKLLGQCENQLSLY